MAKLCPFYPADNQWEEVYCFSKRIPGINVESIRQMLSWLQGQDRRTLPVLDAILKVLHEPGDPSEPVAAREQAGRRLERLNYFYLFDTDEQGVLRQTGCTSSSQEAGDVARWMYRLHENLPALRKCLRSVR